MCNRLSLVYLSDRGIFVARFLCLHHLFVFTNALPNQDTEHARAPTPVASRAGNMSTDKHTLKYINRLARTDS